MTWCGDQDKINNQYYISDFSNIAGREYQGYIHNLCCKSEFCNMARCGDQGKIKKNIYAHLTSVTSRSVVIKVR